MHIKLSERFGYRKLLRFTIPSIIMVVFTGIYGAVDGVFIANFLGSTHFAAVNLIYPILFLVGAFGFMIGAGGSALISKTMGEGNREKANEIFSFLVYFSLIVSTIIAVVGICLLPQIASLLTTDTTTQHYCVLYGRILLIALPASVMQFEFGAFFVAAEKPKLGLLLSASSGVTNLLLDALFILVFQWGIVGAAVASACGQLIGGVIPLFYFFHKNDSPLRLGKTRLHLRSLLKTCTNGASEFMTNISVSLVTILYNHQLQKMAGELGVNAYAAIACIGFIFLSIFLGYSSGVAPVVAFHYGAKNKDELHSLFKRSLSLVSCFAIVLFAASLLFASPLAAMYADGSAEMHALTEHGIRLYAFSLLLSGFNIFASAFFTALNDGGTSAFISFLRTLFLQATFVLVLPLLWGLDGIWLAALFAEGVCIIASILLLIFKKKRYGY